MRKPSLPTPLTRPIGWRAAAAVIAGAPTGALVGALVVLGALPLLGQGTRRGEHAAHRPAATTTTAARLISNLRPSDHESVLGCPRRSG